MRSRGHCEDFAGARSVEREFGLKDLHVRVRFCTLADGGHRIVHPRPAADGETGDWTQCVGEGGVAAFYASNGEGVVFASNIVRVMLAVHRQVAVGLVVAGETLVAGDSSALENRGESRGSRLIWVLLGAKAVAALTEVLYENSTRGSRSSQLFWSSLTTIANI